MDIKEYGQDFYRRYTQREAADIFLPVFNRIFLPADDKRSLLGGRDSASAVFRQSDWKTVVSIPGPWWGCLISRPTEEPGPKDENFWNPETKEWEPLRPLMWTLVEFEIDEIVHMSIPREPGLDETADLLDRDRKGQLVYKGAITTPPAADMLPVPHYQEPCYIVADGVVFSRDGRWGIYGDTDDFTVIGGEPDLMARYIDNAGGEEFLKACFFSAAPRVPYSPGMPGKDFLLTLCDLAGWEPTPALLARK